MSSPPTRNRIGPLLWMGLLLVLALAFALRLFHLSTNSLWGDEASSVYTATRSLAEIPERLQRGVHPPLYFVTLHFWILLAGASELSLRFVSLFFGVIAVAGTFALGRRILGSAVGLGAALLLAINPLQVWYSQEARMYTMLTALGLLASILFVKLVERWSGRLFWGYVLTMALTLFTHYYGAFFLAFHNLYGLVVLGWGQRDHWRRWLGSQGLAFLLFLPWLVLSFAALPTARQDVPIANPLVESWEQMLLGRTLDASMTSWAALPVTLVFLWGLWALRRRHALSIAGLYFATAVGLPFLVSGFRTVEARYLVTASPAYVLILATALFSSRKLAPLGLLLALALVAVGALSLKNLYFNPAYGKGSYGALTREVAALAQSGDVVVVNGASQLFQYNYYRPSRPADFYVIPSSQPMDKEASLSQLNDLAQRYSGIWLFKSSWMDYDPEMVVAKWLDENAYPVSFRSAFGHWGSDEFVAYYRMAPKTSPAWQARAVTFGEQMTLLGYSLEDQEPAGGSLTMRLQWRGEPSLKGDYKVFLHLRDAQGNLWAQRDAPPGNGARPTSRWIPGEPVTDRHGLRIAPGTPPGEYQLYLGVYPSEGGAPLATAGAEKAPQIKLASIKVTPASTPTPTEAVLPSHKSDTALGPDLRLVGYDLPERLSPGRPAAVKLYWQAQGSPSRDYALVISASDARGNVSSQRFPVSPWPTTQWRPGEVVVGIYPLLPGPRLQSGEATIEVEIEGTDAAFGLPTRPLVQARPRSLALPNPQHLANAELGGVARLLGYDLEQSPTNLRLTLYWQAQAETEVNYHVFTHLVDASGRPIAQHDGLPDGGAAPTASWLPPEIVTDSHGIALPARLAPGEYRVLVGLYDPASGRRLLTADGQDALWLSQVRTTP